MGKENQIQPLDLLPTPFPLTNRPTVSPPNLSQNTGSSDFLDHSIPAGFGIIKGKVIDDATGAALAEARVTIPELKISTRSDKDGNFAFGPIQIGTSPGAELDVTLEAQVPGYGKHTMINVGVFSQDTATVLLTLKKRTAATRWFGLAGKKDHDNNGRAPLLMSNFSAPAGSLFFGPLTFTASTTSPPPYIRVAIFPLNSDGTAATTTPIRRDSVDFAFYMKHVLGNEWGTDSTWKPASLKAGAMAVKNYGWWFVINPKYTYSDIDNSQSSQVYNPYISYSSTDQAIDTMSSTGWYQNGAIFESKSVLSKLAGIEARA